jgi:dCMP deaminase
MENLYQSRKLCKKIRWKSEEELSRMIELDNEDSVLEWSNSVFSVSWVNEKGKFKKVTPNFMVRTLKGWSVEYFLDELNSENLEEIDYCKNFFKKDGIDFVVIPKLRDIEVSIEPIIEEYNNSWGRFKRISLLYSYMKMTQSISLRSTCLRRAVGCLVVKENLENVYSIGYNGSAAGEENGCKKLESGKCGCIHAEINALKKLKFPIEESILLCTLAPCLTCSQEIVKFPIKKVIYLENYRDDSGLKFLVNSGIEIKYWNDLVDEKS